MLVLGYHSILEEPLPQPFRYHHLAAELQQHLEWLSRYCEPVGLEGVGRWFRGDWRGRKPPVAITFDDGYRNNATLAADMLSGMGFPAVFFLSSGYVGTEDVLWPDELFIRIQQWKQGVIRAADGSSVTVPEGTAEREALAFRILQACKGSPERERLEYLQYLRQADPGLKIRIYPQAQDFMSWEQARGLARRGFELGSHTVTHPLLSQVDPDQLQREVEQSRATIQANTGARCIAIAYPNGRPADYNAQVLNAVERAGYEWGFTVSGRWNGAATGAGSSGRFTLDRIVPPGHADRDTFALYASGTRSLGRGW